MFELDRGILASLSRYVTRRPVSGADIWLRHRTCFWVIPRHRRGFDALREILKRVYGSQVSSKSVISVFLNGLEDMMDMRACAGDELNWDAGGLL